MLQRILWIDDVRSPPTLKSCEVYSVQSVYQAINLIQEMENKNTPFTILSLDHDAGDYYLHGGDYIKVLDWLEFTQRNNYAIHLHTMNPVGKLNMERICSKNNWEIVEGLK